MPEDLKAVLDRTLELGSARAGVIPVQNGIPYALVPQGYTLQSLDAQIYNERAERPQRIVQGVVVDEAESFLKYWELFADGDSQAFAMAAENRVSGVLDYHESSLEEPNPRWRKHWVTLALTPSDEWKEWTGSNKKQMTQADFAEFLEDHAPDITDPSAATFIDAARDLRANTEVLFESKVTAQNGSVSFGYKETTTGSMGTAGKIEIPERFKISVQVYLGMPRVDVEARLRYRVNSGKLTMWYDLYRVSYVQRMAFEGVVAKIQEGIGRKVFIGKP